MGLRNRIRDLTKSVDDLDHDRLVAGFGCIPGLEPLATVALRRPVRVGGEVKTVRVVPRAGAPSLEVTVSDGSGEAVAVFHGRRRITGLHCGRGLMLEGVARRERNRVVIVNPAYTLLTVD